jgi:propionyl-CoA carboxylase alpha chain
MADTHGNILYLHERECSIQRRHQKVVEEAPSAILTPELRKKMGEAAVKVAQSCGYVGAGTVEFLMDADHNFYFLEMNTRLQVEHPVTELITDLDLVELQIKITQGERVTIRQNEVKLKGHAIELRVYAEDSLNDFLPSVGHLEIYQPPVGKNIRVDDGFEQGIDVPIYYDPMLSKLVTYGDSRMEAITKMQEAIANYKIKGVETTLPFGQFVMQHKAFRNGDFDTHFVKNYYNPEALQKHFETEAEIAAKVALFLYQKDGQLIKLPQ